MKMPRDVEQCPECGRGTSYYLMVYDKNIEKWICQKCGKEESRNITMLSRYVDADEWFGKNKWKYLNGDISGKKHKLNQSG